MVSGIRRGEAAARIPRTPRFRCSVPGGPAGTPAARCCREQSQRPITGRMADVWLADGVSAAVQQSSATTGSPDGSARQAQTPDVETITHATNGNYAVSIPSWWEAIRPSAARCRPAHQHPAGTAHGNVQDSHSREYLGLGRALSNVRSAGNIGQSTLQSPFLPEEVQSACEDYRDQSARHLPLLAAVNRV